MINPKFGEICVQAAKIAGQILLDKRQAFSVREKGLNDFVTDADFASQSAIAELIHSHFPDHQFLGEEDLRLAPPSSDNTNENYANKNDANKNDVVEKDISKTDQPQSNIPNTSTGSKFQWIVDPLDGTLNYVHGLQSYSVSIALACEGQVILGAVYDPILDEMFYAEQDSPATLNGVEIQSSRCQDISKSLLVVSLPSKTNRDSPEIERLLRLMENSQSIRRLGSAALNLCYVACGRVDGYLATSVNGWDIAAGSIIAQQANGVVRHLEDRELDLDDARIIAASSPELWRTLYDLAIIK